MFAETSALRFYILRCGYNPGKIRTFSRSSKRLCYTNQRLFTNIPPSFCQAAKNGGEQTSHRPVECLSRRPRHGVRQRRGIHIETYPIAALRRKIISQPITPLITSIGFDKPTQSTNRRAPRRILLDQLVNLHEGLPRASRIPRHPVIKHPVPCNQWITFYLL